MYDIYAETTALNADKLESMLKRFTYKEGWSFSIFTHTSHTVSIFELRIGVSARVSDSLVGEKRPFKCWLTIRSRFLSTQWTTERQNVGCSIVF